MTMENCIGDTKAWIKRIKGKNNIISESDVESGTIPPLFRKARWECPNVTVAMSIMEWLEGQLDDEKLTLEQVDNAFDSILTREGIDIFEGARLWEKYRRLLLDEYEDHDADAEIRLVIKKKNN